MRFARESEPAPVSGDEAEQIGDLAAMLGEGQRLLSVRRSPTGEEFIAHGCAGTLVFRDGKKMRVVPDLPGLLPEEDPGRALMEMLYAAYGIDAGRQSETSLVEFLIRVFTDEVNRLIVRGLRSKYHLVSGNEKAFKGRIVFNEHIRQNYIHKERIYVEYETYSQNRPENRLIKTTLEALSRKTTNGRNMRALKTLLLAMEDIPFSPDADRDFEMCVSDRNMADYDKVMAWCNVFLRGMGLGGAGGGRFCRAVLVDCDDLVSAYVARMASRGRYDGAFMVSYRTVTKTEGGLNGSSVVVIDPHWSFYDSRTGRTVDDARQMYLSAPGYRPIPHGSGDAVRAMAGSYLADVFA